VANRLPDGRGRQALAKALEALASITHADPGHVVFVDAATLGDPPAPGVWRVGIGPPPSAWRAGESKDFIGPFVLEKRHPLLLGITLGGVVWTGAMPVAPGVLRPVASAGGTPLLGTRRSTGGSADADVFVNLDLGRTNLIRSPDWPILISNVIERRRHNLPGPERWNYRIGEWVRVRLGRTPKGPLRFRCGGVERALPSAGDIEFRAPAPGGLVQILEGEEVLFELGVNFFDESETDLRRQATGDVGALGEPPRQRGEGGPASDPLFWILLAIAAGAVLGNWFLLAPRRSAA
jgi:hypothetical protein